MASLSHGARHLRHGIGVIKQPARSIHISSRPSSTHRFVSETRTFFSRFVSHLFTPGLSHSTSTVSVHPAHIRPAQFSNPQSISARYSLPVRHALSRPFSPPRLPKPPVVPANVTQVGLGTARAFHSGRPIFQNMVDNVPITTRALWEAEWELKVKKKEARRVSRAARNKTMPKSHEMLKPKRQSVIAVPQSELDIYFPVQPAPAVTTHLLVPLAPTPTARIPLSARTDTGDVHPLLPIAGLAAIHACHRLHSLRVSTLFARLDAANAWDDPGVNVDAYAFGPRHDAQDAQEKQCTVLRVTFRGWDAARVRSILGDSAGEWYSIEETDPDGHPTRIPLLDPSLDVSMSTHSESPPPESVGMDSTCVSEVEMDDVCDVLSTSPIRASASAQHDLVLPTLDFSSAFSDALENLPPSPQPVIFLRTVSELTRDVELASQTTSVLSDSDHPEGSWEWLSSDS